MDGAELELVCPCGHENFDRIVVQRKPGGPIVTDFVMCVGCKAMYYAPQRPREPPEWQVGHDMKAIGPGRPDSSEALKRDAKDAAKDDLKPGRSGRR
jgi:hypothetical protein